MKIASISFASGLIFATIIWSALVHFGSIGEQPAKAISTVLKSGVVSIHPRTSPKDKNNAPLFVLDIGPEKTGTTTAQFVAANNEELLNSNNIYFLGHYGKTNELKRHNMCYSCYQGKDKQCKGRWQRLGKLIQKHYDARHTAFLSEELLSKYRDDKDEQRHLWDNLVPILENWQVRVIISYRDLYDWAPSYYTQRMSPKDKKKRTLWPGKGGEAIPTFPEYFEQDMGDHFHRMLSMKARWERHFPNVWVFDMYSEGHYPGNFYCQMLPEANSLCESLNSKKKEVHLNDASSKSALHHDMIAVEAYRRGHLHPDISRVEARDAIEEHALKIGLTEPSHFPQTCLSHNQTELLYAWSEKLKATLLPHSKSSLKNGFAEAVDARKFCSVDAGAVLVDARWLNFIKNDLGPGNWKTEQNPGVDQISATHIRSPGMKT